RGADEAEWAHDVIEGDRRDDRRHDERGKEEPGEQLLADAAHALDAEGRGGAEGEGDGGRQEGYLGTRREGGHPLRVLEEGSVPAQRHRTRRQADEGGVVERGRQHGE